MANILNVISASSPMGGTIVKLRILMKKSEEHTHYLYHPGYDSTKDNIMENIKWCEENGIIAYYGIHNRNVYANARHISKIIKEHNIDIVHYYFNFEQSFAPLVKLFNPDVKMVRSFVGYESSLSFYRRSLLKISILFVHNYIYISEYIKRCYEIEFRGLKNKNSTIIYNGPVNVRESQKKLSLRKKIVAVGAFNKHKNSMVLIEAFKVIENDKGRKDLQLYIIGDGPLREECEQRIRDYKLTTIHLEGYTNKVPEYLDDCAVYVHPAITEGFGIAVVEAMQMGCPCVVADKGALPELIIDGECGYVVDAFDPKVWADKILKLYDDNELRVKMGTKASQRAQSHFSLDTFVRNHDEYYKKIITI